VAGHRLESAVGPEEAGFAVVDFDRVRDSIEGLFEEKGARPLKAESAQELKPTPERRGVLMGDADIGAFIEGERFILGGIAQCDEGAPR
jgi:hypothetical protein